MSDWRFSPRQERDDFNRRTLVYAPLLCLVLFLVALFVAYHPPLIDRPISHSIGLILGRSKTLDQVMVDFDTRFVFSGVVVMSSLWGAWFRRDSVTTRGRIVVGALAAVAASFVSRVLQHVFHAHQRPYYDTSLPFHHFFSDTLNTWNSFPSDHVSAFAGLCTMVWISKAPFRYAVILWTALVESARVYVGAHYPSDIVGGIALGVGIVIASQSGWLVELGRRASRFAALRPALFYGLAFFGSYQIATLGADLRISAGDLKSAVAADRASRQNCGYGARQAASMTCAL